MSPKPLVYVAGPYRGEEAMNTRRAMAIGHRLLIDGVVTPIVPHLSLFWDVAFPVSVDRWLDYDLRLMEACDCVYRMLGSSEGADAEVERAMELGIPVFYQADGHEEADLMGTPYSRMYKWAQQDFVTTSQVCRVTHG
jgi:hypothetical protein